jgi:hypothetical protein
VLTKDNRLRLIRSVGDKWLAKSSKPLGNLMAFTRILCVYEKGSKTRFYVGTEEVTDVIFGETNEVSTEQERSAYFRFGSNYNGDMLETRIWTKALTLEEISATANHSLTGYERELLAYYRMDEGKGETVTDYAHGATLYLNGCSWNKQKGYSLRLDNDSVKLAGNLLGRSKTYDFTLMCWFKTTTADAPLFSSKYINISTGNYADDTWHYYVLAVSRTYNTASVFMDGNLIRSESADAIDALTGTMYLGGNGFKGNIDEFVIFEQALPKSLVELYHDNALTGDEMGLFAYLPFEEQYTNPNGIIEQRFSVNDQRIFKDANGNVVNKIVPLVLTANSQQPIADNINAPIKSHGVLNKLYFNWAFNNDELMINILNKDAEVNKQSIYITVRDVEDLNGNPMASPVTWTAFVDRNSLKWSAKKLVIHIEDNADADVTTKVDILNNSGKRHQYTIESLPSWLSVNTSYGAIDPMGEQTVRLSFDSQIAVGEYSDIIYLTDEDGLSEPLQIEYIVEAIPPYDALDEHKYPYNMSVCAQVKIGEEYDANENDIVYALYRNECVGSEHVSFDNVSNKSKVYLTVYGNDEMTRKPIRFQLWQASTGKLFDLTTNVNVLFAHGFVYNCGSESPLILTASGSETQAIELSAGWNWISTYMDLTASQGALSACMTANDPWTDGDLIKNPYTRQFCTYDETTDNFAGTLNSLHFSQIYMAYAANGNTMRIAGEMLAEDSMKISVRGDGQWSVMPCLFDRTTSLTEALADYYQKATPGDLVKARNRFATFTENKRWEGNLTALRPGEGYLFRRMAPGTVDIAFHRQENRNNQNSRNAPKNPNTPTLFSNPKAATNMTMIAVINDGNGENGENGVLKVYLGDDLVGKAEPFINPSLSSGAASPLSEASPLYFLTIQSDQVGELRFELDGQSLTPEEGTIRYTANAHAGSLKAPVLLRPTDGTGVYKLIENDHVVIIRNNEKYDVTGKKME